MKDQSDCLSTTMCDDSMFELEAALILYDQDLIAPSGDSLLIIRQLHDALDLFFSPPPPLVGHRHDCQKLPDLHTLPEELRMLGYGKSYVEETAKRS